MAKKRGLGRGIGALIPSTTQNPEPAAQAPDSAVETSAPLEEGELAQAQDSADAGSHDVVAESDRDASNDPGAEVPGESGADVDPAEAATETAAEPDVETAGSNEEADSEPDAEGDSGRARPVDMFFSGEATGGSSAKRNAMDIADGWSRDARSKRKSGTKKTTAKPARTASAVSSAASSDEAAAGSGSAPSTAASLTPAPAPAPETESAGNTSVVSAASDEARYDGPELLAVPGAEFAEVPIGEIRENPRNPRTVFDEDELSELAYSLREVGVLQPIVIRPITNADNGESFELVMGERRWRAAKKAGLATIPAIIRDTTDDDLLRDALLENLHRSQLNPLEEAAAYGQLLEDFGCTQDELAERIGRSRPQISNTLRLLRLPPLVQRRLASGALSAGHARALLGLDDSQLQEELAQRIVNEGLSVRAVERLIANGVEPTSGTRSVPRRSSYNPRVVSLTSQLSSRFEAPVKIDVGKRKGKITVEFTNLDDLERVVERLGLDAE